jgi:hypothetical protein
MIRKLSSLCLLLITILLLNNPAHAANKSSPDEKAELEHADIYELNDDHALIVESGQAARIVQLSTGTFTTIQMPPLQIAQVSILRHPDKIVMLTQTPQHTVQKIVMNFAGETISSQSIPVSWTSGKIKWSAPYGIVKERLMVQRDNRLLLYESPWKKPFFAYNAEVIDRGYEYVTIADWDFAAYPYVAIKYDAQGIMSDTYFLRLVDMRKPSTIVKTFFNTNFSMKIDDTELRILTSYRYGMVPANRPHPNQEEQQTYYERMKLSTGANSLRLADRFQDSGDSLIDTGWVTEERDTVIFSGDLGQHTWSLYDRNGKRIAQAQPWPNHAQSKLITYDQKSRLAYFLVYHEGEPAIETVQLG